MKTYNEFSDLPGAGPVPNTGDMRCFNTLVENRATWNMGKVYDFGGYEIWVYSRNEHLPSHVHIQKGTSELGKISLYPVVEVVDPETSKIPAKDRTALVESVKVNKKKCQKEWNRLNGKPVSAPRKEEG